MEHNDDFFKNAKNINLQEEEDNLEEDVLEEENINNEFDYNKFMNQSSAEYMMYSTMDLMKTMNIMSELRQLFSALDDWDRIVLYYAYELMQRNMQVAYKLLLYLFKSESNEFVSQIIYWGLLLYCLSNVQTAYAYLIYRVYLLNKDLAYKLHEYLKEEFMFFENPQHMSGTFNNNILPNRLTRYQN